MGPITKFVLAVYEDGVLNEEHTPEELQAKLLVREGVDDRVVMFIRHATKTAFANLTVYEMLAGKIKAMKLANRGEDYLMDRTIAEPLEKRVACVLREAKWWDQQWEMRQQEMLS